MMLYFLLGYGLRPDLRNANCQINEKAESEKVIADKSWMRLGSVLSDNQCRIAAHTQCITMPLLKTTLQTSLLFWDVLRCFHMFRTCCELLRPATFAAPSVPSSGFTCKQGIASESHGFVEPLGSLNQLNPHAQNLGLDTSCPLACQQSDVLHGPPVHGRMWMLRCCTAVVPLIVL